MASVEVTGSIHLDGRLALFHRSDRWLAVADTHFGFSEAMCRAGALFPLWGNATLAARLEALCLDYRPATLILLGDLVHGRVGRESLAEFIRHLESLVPELVLIRGNHDRCSAVRSLPLVDSWQTGSFFFHHGHLELSAPPDTTEVTGHWHPAVSFQDGAGLSLKLPAFVQGPRRWILPAFSPWAGGMTWKPDPSRSERRWVCSPKRVFEVLE